MMDPATIKAAFDDELQKIAGELQGFTRIGKKPIGIERLLERERESEVTPSEITDQVKTSAFKSPIKPSTAATLALGALGMHSLNRANQDRKIGKQVRIQQRGGGF